MYHEKNKYFLLSEIYSKVAQNSVVQARPAILHFGGFDVDNTQRLVLQIANVSGDVQRMHIIPPQTKYFYIKYTKNVSSYTELKAILHKPFKL